MKDIHFVLLIAFKFIFLCQILWTVSGGGDEGCVVYDQFIQDCQDDKANCDKNLDDVQINIIDFSFNNYLRIEKLVSVLKFMKFKNIQLYNDSICDIDNSNNNHLTLQISILTSPLLCQVLDHKNLLIFNKSNMINLVFFFNFFLFYFK